MFVNPLNWVSSSNMESEEEQQELTENYVYNVLFKEGKNSDVILNIANRDWHLHKFILDESEFFEGLLGLVESLDHTIYLPIADQNVTEKGVETALGFLYKNDIDIPPKEMLSIVAAAKHFLLTELLQRCIDIMKNTVSVDNVMKFRYISKQYKLNESSIVVHQWLDWNFMIELSVSITRLRQISAEDLNKIIKRPNFYIQSEKSLYSMLKMWLFLKLWPNWKGRSEQCLKNANGYFITLDGPILESERARPFAAPFEQLRVQHLIDEELDKETLQEEKLTPINLIEDHETAAWQRMMKIADGNDNSLENCDEEKFNKYCYRCGRVIPNDERYTWRWTAFQYGIDLVITFSQRSLIFRRNVIENRESVGCINSGQKGEFMFSAEIADFDDRKIPNQIVSTGKLTITMFKEQELVVLQLTPTMKYPVIISTRFLMSLPINA